MAKELISRCDECGSTEGAEEFVIIRNGVQRETDLCADHKRPVVEAFERGVESASNRKPRQGGRSAHSVIPIEEWDPALLQPRPESVPTPEAGADGATAELLAAARPLLGGTELSVKVAVAVGALLCVVNAGEEGERERAAVLALNPERIRVPKTPEGARFREALTAYVKRHQREK
ncbi:hypothetical protein AB0O42_05695 [Streptomyces sp. NPDC089922]|uniref:hypothetical protein n=1 Tax=Streptomyces sp. NPDC089922 TaxID=3155189 RepID=UPI00341915BC